jgi:hypothetical protein
LINIADTVDQSGFFTVPTTMDYYNFLVCIVVLVGTVALVGLIRGGFGQSLPILDPVLSGNSQGQHEEGENEEGADLGAKAEDLGQEAGAQMETEDSRYFYVNGKKRSKWLAGWLQEKNELCPTGGRW